MHLGTICLCGMNNLWVFVLIKDWCIPMVTLTSCSTYSESTSVWGTVVRGARHQGDGMLARATQAMFFFLVLLHFVMLWYNLTLALEAVWQSSVGKSGICCLSFSSFIDGTLFQKGKASLESAFVMLYIMYLLWSDACFLALIF